MMWSIFSCAICNLCIIFGGVVLVASNVDCDLYKGRDSIFQNKTLNILCMHAQMNPRSFIGASIAFNQMAQVHRRNGNKAPVHQREKSIQMSGTFVRAVFTWISKPQKKRFITTWFPWRITIYVYVGSCQIFFFKEAKFIYLPHQATLKEKKQDCVVCRISLKKVVCFVSHHIYSHALGSTTTVVKIARPPEFNSYAQPFYTRRT